MPLNSCNVSNDFGKASSETLGKASPTSDLALDQIQPYHLLTVPPVSCHPKVLFSVDSRERTFK